MDYIKKLLFVSPVAIGLVYLILGFFWIGFSDQFVLSIFDEPETITAMQSYKGWGFIVASSVFIYILVQINNNKLGEVISEKETLQKEFEAIFEQAPVGIVYHKPDEKWLRVNQQCATMFGYSKSELFELDFKDFVHPDDLEAGRQLDRKLFDGTKTSYKTEKRYIRKDGTQMIGKLSKAIIHNGSQSRKFMVAIIEDITRQKEMEEQLRKALDEKELLLAEVLHRVNNNLALITGFLEMELVNIKNKGCQSVFKKSQIRIKSIGIVHQKLYQADDFSNLPLVEYVQEILTTVSRNWSNGIEDASFKSNAAGVKLNVNQAIPCGLILNELVTNAYKHAFPKGKKEGEIHVDIRKNGNEITFSVSDNGIGLPDPAIFEEANTLGFTIVNILCKQLHANVSIDTNNGTQFEISFIEDRYKKGAASNIKV